DALDLEVDNSDAIGYSALEYEHILWALRAIPFPAPQVVFLDYGAGKGRVLAAAAAQPFQKVQRNSGGRDRPPALLRGVYLLRYSRNSIAGGFYAPYILGIAEYHVLFMRSPLSNGQPSPGS